MYYSAQNRVKKEKKKKKTREAKGDILYTQTQEVQMGKEMNTERKEIEGERESERGRDRLMDELEGVVVMAVFHGLAGT